MRHSPLRHLAFVARAGVAALLLLSTEACVAHSGAMHPALASDLTAAPGVAKVVFVRPSKIGGAVVVTILDQNGRFLGASEAQSNFTASMPPGSYVFVSWSESVPAMRATLAQGRVYFVEVAPHMGLGSARLQLLALTPRAENWAELPKWLQETRPLTPDVADGQAHVQQRLDTAREKIEDAKKHLAGYDAADLAMRTLAAEDGMVSVPFAGGGAPVGPPLAPVTVAVAAPLAAGAPAPSSPAVAPAPPAAAGAPAAAAPPSSAPPPAKPGHAEDLVMLKNGGRVRGRVMEDEPASVSLRLANGTTRVIKRAEVDHVEYGQ